MKKTANNLLGMNLATAMHQSPVLLAVALLTFISGQSALAGPGALPSTPLLLSSQVEPNVFFVLDDSGSMKLEILAEEGKGHTYTLRDGGPETIGVDRKNFTPHDAETPNETLPPSTGIDPEWDKGWVFRTHHGNKTYYNPDITYTPWAGYEDAPPKAAPSATNASGDTIDLTKDHIHYVSHRINSPTSTYTKTTLFIPTYYIWKDGGDGVLEATDAHKQIEIRSGNAPFPSGRDYDAEIQNFANWFSFYRSRSHVMKAAIGKVIQATDSARMGLELFNGEKYRLSPKSMSDPTNKETLLGKLHAHAGTSNTPAREALVRVGDLFKTKGNDAPILPKAKGGECQKNYSILVTDGYWTDNPLKSPVGNVDATSGPFSGGSYGDSNSNSLADIAMYYYKNDLRSDLDDLVPTTPGVDEARHQHLVTYTIAFGVKGKLDPTTDKPTDSSFIWTSTNSNTGKIDDLWHAAYNGRGKYLTANNASELTKSVNEIITNIADRVATQSAASISSYKLTTDTKVFLAEYNPKQWQGDLKAYKVDDPATSKFNPTPLWSAASKLDDLKPEDRVIITRTGDKGVAFEWDNLSQSQKDDLKISPQNVSENDTTAKARLDFIRGSRSNEGKKGYGFRKRATLLGDIVNSSPIFLGVSTLRWPDQTPFPTQTGNRHSEFKASQKSRQEMIYIGANDGMLHGFDADTGEELLAYIPSNLFSTEVDAGLHYLTDPDYTHRFYNDLTPSISDIYVSLDSGFVGSGKSWRTVLISGQRGGGRGVYALDITDPTKFKESNANKISVWEFTHKDLGYTYSQPQIGLANNGKWVAIFGNGYNDQGAGKGKLFILDIAAGSDGTWGAGDYWVIDTGSGEPTDRNGLATPALVDLDGNGTIDRVYAGDLKGQMWAFDLSAEKSADWNIAGKEPLFRTQSGAPITTKPSVAKHPTEASDTSDTANIMVFFGSGQYLVATDKTTKTENYFYGVWDKGTYNLAPGNLLEQTYEADFTLNGLAARVLTRDPVDYTDKFGWHIALPDDGERSVTNPVVRGKAIFFNSFAPYASSPCSSTGYGYSFVLDLATGGSLTKPLVDVNNDGAIDDQDKASDSSNAEKTIAAMKKEGFLSQPKLTEKNAFHGGESGSDSGCLSNCDTIKPLRTLPTGRFSWQELIQ